MAASGYTPISLYYSTTASAAPTAGNLVNGELAINITDGKLYYKDNSGVVQLLASKAALTSVDSISFGTTGLTPATATTGVVTVAGTLVVGNGGTGLTSLTAGYIPYGAGTSAFASSSNLYFDGSNLGIGTSSPNRPLTIYNGTTPRIQLINSTTGTTASNGSELYISGSDLFLNNRENANLYFGTNNTVKVTLDSSGNLGLGVTPSAWESILRAEQFGYSGDRKSTRLNSSH